MDTQNDRPMSALYLMYAVVGVVASMLSSLIGTIFSPIPIITFFAMLIVLGGIKWVGGKRTAKYNKTTIVLYAIQFTFIVLTVIGILVSMREVMADKSDRLLSAGFSHDDVDKYTSGVTVLSGQYFAWLYESIAKLPPEIVIHNVLNVFIILVTIAIIWHPFGMVACCAAIIDGCAATVNVLRLISSASDKDARVLTTIIMLEVIAVFILIRRTAVSDVSGAGASSIKKQVEASSS